MHIQKGEEWKTNFQTCYAHFKYVVMPFGLTNAHSIFQNLMNDVFHEYLDDFMVYHIDDIFILSKNVEGHEPHVWIVLDKLREVGLYVKLEKCEFHEIEMKFLEYIISEDDVCMDPHKV